jgi:hypothetical protein
VPIVLRHNAQLELNLAEYHGAVTLGELEAVAAYLAENRSFLKSDCLSLVLPGAHFDRVAFADLDRLFSRYKAIYAPMTFQIIRRSAWLCQSPAARPHVDYWIGGRDTLGAMSSTLRQFDSFAEAGDWLVLSEAETIALAGAHGFTELDRFEDPPAERRAG